MEVLPSLMRLRGSSPREAKHLITYRSGYAIAALLVVLIETAIAVWLNDRLIRPYLGDGLAVVLVYCMLRAVASLSMGSAVFAALAIAFAIETAQLYDLLSAIGLAESVLARMALGTSFDPLDLLAYIVGGGLALSVETIRHRVASRHNGQGGVTSALISRNDQA